ncbi:multiple monosaccharide ABC transporter permease [Haematomicrobium sanguinis]|uniref:multiple monosaccharide ABC transporter permease n=1 Tax=Haematomicrobium sanguinis TaxID=479106 RepID=UPI000691020B|nr:multiple monosaccharide ABC transporter permease [Haematomicrobium sanguinis]
MKTLKQFFGGDLRQFGMVIALVAIVLFFHFATGQKVLSPTNMQNLFNGNSYILVLAIGMVFVIIAGNIDLSVGSVSALVGIVIAISVTNWGLPWWLGILIGLALALAIGAWQGFWTAFWGIPAFIVTLAGMLGFRGLQQLIGASQTIPVPREIQFIGAGYLPEIGPNTGYNNLTVLIGLIACAFVIWGQLRSRANDVKIGAEVVPMWITVTRIAVVCVVILYITYLFATGRPGTSLPVSAIILIALTLIYSFIASRTVLGRHVYAFGGNRNAAELSGVRTKWVNFFVMMNMSFLAGIAAVMFIGRSTASGPADGLNWELDAIAAVFIGGAAVSGGVGTVLGSVVGGLVMAFLTNGLQLMGASAEFTSMIKGLVLLLAVAVDVYNKNQGRPSITGLLMKNFKRSQATVEPSVEQQQAETLNETK